MGKGGSKPKIPYYYMTIHYGVCHGPIDAINQIRIKEKPIFCSTMVEPSNLYVSWPELFGGETKEGGVEGVVECYFGGPDQLASNDIANRKGDTAATHVGYRGVAHVFFRGFTDSEIGFLPRPSTLSGLEGALGAITNFLVSRWGNESPGGGAIAIPHDSLASTGVGDIFDPSNNRPSGGGFHWITNNPYLPSAWVHVTRIGSPIEGVPARILHAPFGDEVGSQSGNYPVRQQAIPGTGGPSQEVSLSGLEAQVDAGNVAITMRTEARATWSVTIPGTGQVAGEPANLTNGLWAFAIMQDGSTSVDPFIGDAGSGAAVVTGVGTVIAEMTRILRPGVRRLFVYGVTVHGFLAQTEIRSSRYRLDFIALGPPLCENNGTIGAPPDMNPAQIIAECLTNRMWGMGNPLVALDIPSFTAAGERLFSEGFGLSMLWKGQTTIEKFVSEVLDHIQAMLFISTRTGLWKLRLIRGDYNTADLRRITPDNCVAKNRQRKAEGEIINEIVVSYTDPVTEESKTVTFHDIGRIAQLGQIVSDTRNYYGCRSEALANFLGARDIRSASYPLFSADIEADRSFRDIEPGDVLLLDWPEDGIIGMPVRVGKVNYGRTGDAKVKFSVTEDVFGLEQTTYSVPSRSQWQSPDVPPQDLPRRRAIEAPLPLLLRSGFSLSEISDDRFPEVVTAVFGDDPAQRIEFIELFGDEVQPNGSVTQKGIAYIERTSSGLLPGPLTEESESTLPGIFVRALARPEVPSPGEFIYIDGPNESGEWVMLDVYDGATDLWSVARGMFDTVPRAWPTESICWYVESALSSLDPTANSAGTPTTFKLLPKVSFGTLQPEDATEVIHTPSERPYLPHRPANVQIDGNGFGPAVYATSDPGGIPATVPVTWANRNRLLEDGIAPRWTDGTVTPEAGQTTTIRVYELSSGDLVFEQNGIVGTSFDLGTSTLLDFRFYVVRVSAERDGFESLQSAARTLEIVRLGYGNNYGYDYGQNDGS